MGQRWLFVLCNIVLISLFIVTFAQNDLVLVDHWVLNGHHYSRTLEAWLSKLDQNIDRVRVILNKAYGDDAPQHLFNWRLFFIFCSEVFNYERGNQWHVSFHLFKNRVYSAL